MTHSTEQIAKALDSININESEFLSDLGKQTDKTDKTDSPNVINSNGEMMTAIFLNLENDEYPMTSKVSGAITAQTKYPARPWDQTKNLDRQDINWFFTLSTYKEKNGEIKRRKDSFYRAFGVYCDDIGTKVDIKRLVDCPPSYLIETSKGNHHAGYLFDQPCADAKQLDALQNALISAKLCDAGANGPTTRLGRLPFSHNSKYEPAHKCRLIEWYPNRRYSIDQLISKLDLPTATQSKKLPSNVLTLKADKNDASILTSANTENTVVSKLKSQGLYKNAIREGIHDVTCPWVAEHTKQMDSGSAYFEPNNSYPIGGYKCQHSHGDNYRIHALLEFLNVSINEAKNKPIIRVRPGDMHLIVDAAEFELSKLSRYYQRGGLISFIRTDKDTKSTQIKALNYSSLMNALASCIIWEKYSLQKNDWVVIDPPEKHTRILLDAEKYNHLNPLVGISRQPYLTSDGALVNVDGYNIESGVFGVFNPEKFEVLDNPTHQDAKVALNTILELLNEFSFKSDFDQSAAIAAILTATLRPSLTNAPMFHVKAPIIASGKSYLCEMIAAFAADSKPTAIAFPTTDEECQKLLLATLLEAPSVVMFDNLTSDLIPYKSLCSALTTEFITGRVLGVSKTATVGTKALFLSSGNNVSPVKDMSRRCLTITLDPKLETPATREFTKNPLNILQKERSRYVSLALIIVRAWLSASSPITPCKPLGSFDQWSNWVRQPLMWLGMEDPAQPIFEQMAQDPDREILGHLLTLWRSLFGSSATKCREVISKAEGLDPRPEVLDLKETLMEVADSQGKISPQKLGRWLMRFENRIVDGLRLERDRAASNSVRWKVVIHKESGLSVLSVNSRGGSINATACGYLNSSKDDEEIF